MVAELQEDDTLERIHERMQSMVNDTQPVSLEHCYIVALCCLYHGHSLLERVYEMSDWARDIKYFKSHMADVTISKSHAITIGFEVPSTPGTRAGHLFGKWTFVNW